MPCISERVASIAPRSTGCGCARASSVSILEASAIWLSSRSSLFTSSPTSASSFARFSSSVTRRAVSTALSTELSGFFTSCATSATKRSIASMRTQSASVISRNDPDKRPISSFARGEVGNRYFASAACAHPLGRAREPPHRARDRPREIEAENDGDPECDTERLDDGEAGIAHALQNIVGVRPTSSRAPWIRRNG